MDPRMGSAAIAAGIHTGNINLAQSADTRELMDLSTSASTTQLKHAQLLLKFEAQRRIRTVNAPTDNEEIKRRLRELGHPITLFGETAGDRRLRLQTLMAEAEVAAAVAAEGLAAVTASATAAAGGVAAAESAMSALVAGGARAAAVLAAASAPKLELFYTPGTEALAAARTAMAAYSFSAAAARLAREGVTAAAIATAAAAAAQQGAYLPSSPSQTRARLAKPLLSIAGDDRPLCAAALSPDAALLAVGSWGPTVRLWDLESATCVAALKGHTDRVGCVAWRPGCAIGRLTNSTSSSSNLPLCLTGRPSSEGGAPILATASTDGTGRLWRIPVDDLHTVWGGGGGGEGMEEEGMGGSGSGSGSSSSSSSSSSSVTLGKKALLETGVRECAALRGHVGRLCSIAWHPSGSYIGTTGFDRTWRLWDASTGQELLLQEGHAREVYPIAFHPDGSLVATGDLSGLGRVWDLRSGKSVFTLRGHGVQLLSLDCSPGGTLLASGSEDATSMVWELRQQRVLYTLPAHSGLVSKVKFSPHSSTHDGFLATASYDGTVKTWSSRDWSPLSTLSGHDGKVTGLDLFGGGGGQQEEGYLVSTGWDRTIKVWGPEKRGGGGV